MPKSVKQIKRMQHTENDRIFYSEFEVDEIKKKLESKIQMEKFLLKKFNDDDLCIVIKKKDFNSVFEEVKKK